MPAPPQFTGFPDWMQNTQSMDAIRAMQAQLPGLFNTRPMQQAYNTDIASTFDQGRALAAAGGAAYQNRALQSGASQLGSGFSEAQAMLPIYGQRNSMLSDLQQKMLTANNDRAQLGTELADRLGQLYSTRQSMMSDYATAQQKLQQDSSQFDTSMGEKSREFNVTSAQQQQENLANQRLQALNIGRQLPHESYSWNTNASGQPVTAMDQQAMGAFNAQKNYWGGLRSNLGALGGYSGGNQQFASSGGSGGLW